MFKPEPEPNWRSMYEDLHKTLEAEQAKYTELLKDYYDLTFKLHDLEYQNDCLQKK